MRLYKSLRAMCLLLPAVFLFSGAAPEEKMELKKTATAEQLVNAIARHTETLAEYLSNEKAFEDNLMKDKVTAKGGAIAVLAHALTQYKDVPAEVHVLAIRAAGRKIATAKSQADAQADWRRFKNHSIPQRSQEPFRRLVGMRLPIFPT